MFQPIVCWSVGNNVLYVLFSLQDSFNGCSRQWIRGLCQPVTQWRRQYVSLGYVSSKCSSQSCKQQQDLYNITFLTSFFRNCFVQKIRVVWFHPVCVQTPLPSHFSWAEGGGWSVHRLDFILLGFQVKSHPLLSNCRVSLCNSFKATFFVNGNRNQVMWPCSSNFSPILQ